MLARPFLPNRANGFRTHYRGRLHQKSIVSFTEMQKKGARTYSACALMLLPSMVSEYCGQPERYAASLETVRFFRYFPEGS